VAETGDPALIGRRVAGKFVVEKFLGGGAMGAVYRARDTSLERKVALKVMHPAVAIDPNFVGRFHREARAASRLDHPNSMRVIEFGEEPDGLLYIAMEYLEGRDLYKVIHEDWPLSDARIADVMMKALAALMMAHEMGVIHRDLKPENIMVLNRKDDEGQDIIKVCDFGIAKITETDDAPDNAPKTVGAKLTTAGLVVGTPEYMSPEQARGEKLDARSDLYSMGIILYQLLTGRTPFLADTALAVVLKHISDAPEPPQRIYPGVHRGLEAICLRALAKTKEDRFQSARDMRTAIKSVMEGRPIPVDPGVIAADTVAGTFGPAPGSALSSQRILRDGEPLATPATTPMSATPQGIGLASAVASEGSAKLTPLGTELATPEERRSRAPIVVLVALAAAAAGGVLVFTMKGRTTSSPTSSAAHGAVAPVSNADPSDSSSATHPAVTPSSIPPLSPSLAPSATLSPEPAASAEPSPKAARRPSALAAHPNAAGATPAPRETAEPAPPPEPPPAPVTPASTPSAPAPPAPPPPAPAAFNPSSCRAVIGAQRSVSGYNANNLSLRGTDAAWTSCAKTSIREKPSPAIAGTVRLRFSDNRAFRSASCVGCPAPLSACIASATSRTVSVSFKSGDATGEPEFEVPVTFSCD
jgi:serine/threonine-protein kinase